MVFLIILVVSLIYFIKINSNETDELTDNLVLNEIENVNKNKDVKDPELNEIATALKNIKPIDFTPYEKEEEEKAIISYDELLSNTGQYELNYLNEEKNGDRTLSSIYVGRTFRSECYGSGRRHNYSWFLTGRCRI